MRRSYFLASVAAGIAASAAGTPVPVCGEDLPTIKVGMLKVTANAPLRIADRFGYFRDEGFKVDFSLFQSSEAQMAFLSTGQLDVGSGAVGSSLYNAVIHGIDVRAVADVSSDPPGYGWAKLMVRTDLIKSGRFKTIADLKGMTVAGAAVASSSAPQLARLLAKAGLRFGDVKREPLPYPEHLIALKNGAIDAALTIEPFAALVADSGVAVKIIGNDQFYPNQQVAALLFTEIFIKDHRDLGLHFMRAYIKGARYYNGALLNGKFAGPNAETVLKIVSDETGIPRGILERTTPIPVNPNGHLNLTSMREDLIFYQSHGFYRGGHHIGSHRCRIVCRRDATSTRPL